MTVGASTSLTTSAGGTPPAPLGALLNRLDWQLSEISQRQHRFEWLRDPHTGQSLAVDAYYASSGVIVIAGDGPAQELTLGLAPAHGLIVIAVDAEDLAGNPSETAKAIRAELVAAGWKPHTAAAALIPVPPPVVSPAPATAPAAARAPAPAAAPAAGGRPVSGARPWWMDTDLADREDAEDDEFELPPLPARHATARSGHGEAEGMWLGLALGGIVLLESVLAIVTLGAGNGDWVLAFGLMLDGAARIAGVIAGGSVGDSDAAWGAALLGSPALWAIAPEDIEGNEPARVARTTAIIAGVVVALGLLAAAL